MTLSSDTIVVLSSAKEERVDSRGNSRDRGTHSPECSAPLGGDERVPPWRCASGTRARGDPVPAEQPQSWTATGNKSDNCISQNITVTCMTTRY